MSDRIMDGLEKQAQKGHSLSGPPKDCVPSSDVWRPGIDTLCTPCGLVVGTAGHIDHGKTALVRALTGIDTDRLAEEKRRGISIDLGFAHLTLADGLSISFIDVPGHERFIKNMLAGVAGIDAVVLVVAADEGIKPQTREHFDICRLLAVRRGIVALTKADAASPEQIEAAREGARRLCEGSFLEGAPVVTVSAVRGQGLDALKEELATIARSTHSREASGPARLPIDRSFTLKGFGAVVTGTLWSGQLRTAELVELHPGKRQVRIRGLQVHGKQTDVARAGQRTAVNLTGIDSSEIRRGFVLAKLGALESSKLLDVAVDWLAGTEIPKIREQLLLHLGTAELPALMKILQPGPHSQLLARLELPEAVLALPGDRFVLRRPSPARTAAGGSVIDPFPPRRLAKTKLIERLQKLVHSDLSKRVQILVEESAAGTRLSDLARQTGLRPEELRPLILNNPALLLADAAERVLSKAWIGTQGRRLIEWLKEFHAKNPTAPGAPIARARLDLEPAVAALVLNGFADVRVQGDMVSLATHNPTFSAHETQLLQKIERAFQQAGFQPPSPSDVLRSAGSDQIKMRALLEMLVKSQKLVRVSEDLIFHADVILHVRKSLSVQKGRKFSVPEFKEWTRISRKYAIPLLEYLDRQRVTRREGDSRVVL